MRNRLCAECKYSVKKCKVTCIKRLDISVPMYLFKSDSYAPVNSIGGTDRVFPPLIGKRRLFHSRTEWENRWVKQLSSFLGLFAAGGCRELFYFQRFIVQWARTAWAEGPVDSVHVAISVGIGRRRLQLGPLSGADSRRDHDTSCQTSVAILQRFPWFSAKIEPIFEDVKIIIIPVLYIF